MTSIEAKPQNLTAEVNPNTVLFFDMDGTLVDTNLANHLSYQKAIRSVVSLIYDLPFDINKRFTRTTLRETLCNLTEREYDQIVKVKEIFYNDFLHCIKLLSNVAQILTKYSKTNTTVLVSHCREDRALKTLGHFGLLDYLDHIFCKTASDLITGRQNKYQQAILTLGVSPNFVIAFEDEEDEIADAKSAGISIINPTFLHYGTFHDLI